MQLRLQAMQGPELVQRPAELLLLLLPGHPQT
jgi:hypothetical protein